jgi:hypothetical protein
MQRFTALILALAMPMCCCVLNVAAGVSCCDPLPKIEQISCCSGTTCQSEPVEVAPHELPCTAKDCQCCLKATSIVQDWSPPVDTVGTTLMELDWTPGLNLLSSCNASTVHCHHPPPWPEDSGPVRGQTILQV